MRSNRRHVAPLWAIPIFAFLMGAGVLLWVFFLALLTGCAHVATLSGGTADGVNCTEWRFVHPVATTTTALICRDENGKLAYPYPIASQSALAPIFSAAGAVIP